MTGREGPLPWQDPTLYVIGIDGSQTVWASDSHPVPWVDGEEITGDEWDEAFQRAIDLAGAP